MGGRAILVDAISEAELAENGGPYRLRDGRPAIPVRVYPRGSRPATGPARAVFVVNNRPDFLVAGGPAHAVVELARSDDIVVTDPEAIPVYVVEDGYDFEPCHDLNWAEIRPYDWYDFQECIQHTNATVTGGTDRNVSFFGNLSGNIKWTTGPLLPDGRVLGTPHEDTRVLLADPVNQTVETFGSMPANNDWIGGVLLPDGRVCCPPLTSALVLLIDPVGQSAETFGDVPGIGFGRRTTSAVRTMDNKVLCAPNELEQILLIDPEAQTTTLFGQLPSLLSAKSINGVLLSDGRVCFTPAFNLQFILADPVSQTLETVDIPAIGGGDSSWGGGCLLPDGRICCVPLGATKVLLFDPYTREMSFFGSLATGPKWVGATLLPDGKVLATPHSTNQLLLIDPIAETTELFGNVSGSNRYEGGALLPDGRVCCIPLSHTQVMVVDLGYSISYNTQVLLSPYLNGKL